MAEAIRNTTKAFGARIPNHLSCVFVGFGLRAADGRLFSGDSRLRLPMRSRRGCICALVFRECPAVFESRESRSIVLRMQRTRQRSASGSPAPLNWKIPRMSKLLVCLILALYPLSSAAQVTAAISGRVEDATGGTVSGAAITVKSLETGATRVTKTDSSGNYAVLSLPLG